MDSRSQPALTTATGAATPLDVYNPVYGSFPAAATARCARGRSRACAASACWCRTRSRSTTAGCWWPACAATSAQHRHRRQPDAEGLGDQQQPRPRLAGRRRLVAVRQLLRVVRARCRAPTRPATPFKPKRGKQVEAGVKWQPTRPARDRRAAVYQLEEKNRLATDPDNVGFSVQRGEVTVKGLELEARRPTCAAWDLTRAATPTPTRRSRAPATRPTSWLPGPAARGHPEAQRRRSWAVHRFAAAAGPARRLRRALRRRVERRRRPVASSALGHAVRRDGVVRDRPGWRFALNANNLTDKQYVASCLERGDCWYGNRRRVFASVTPHLGKPATADERRCTSPRASPPACSAATPSSGASPRWASRWRWPPGMPYDDAQHAALSCWRSWCSSACFCWAFAAASLARVWVVLAGGGALMTGAGLAAAARAA